MFISKPFILLIFIILIFTKTSGFSNDVKKQPFNENDKHSEIINNLIINNINTCNYTKALNYISTLENYLLKEDTFSLVINKSIYKTYLYIHSGKFDSAYYFLIKIIQNLKNNPDSIYLGKFYYYYGLLKLKLNDYSNAEKYLYNALNICQNKNEKYFIAYCNSYIGLIKLNNNEENEAKNFINNAFLLHENINNQHGLALTNLIFSGYFKYFPDSAFLYLENAIKISEKYNFIDILVISILEKNKILAVTKKINDINNLSKNIQNFINQINNQYLLTQIFNYLSEISYLTNNYKKSYIYLKLNENIKDSIFSARFEKNKISFDIEILRNLNYIYFHQLEYKSIKNKKIIQRQRLLILGISILLFFLSLLLTFLIYKYLKLKKSN